MERNCATLHDPHLKGRTTQMKKTNQKKQPTQKRTTSQTPQTRQTAQTRHATKTAQTAQTSRAYHASQTNPKTQKTPSSQGGQRIRTGQTRQAAKTTPSSRAVQASRTTQTNRTTQATQVKRKPQPRAVASVRFALFVCLALIVVMIPLASMGLIQFPPFSFAGSGSASKHPVIEAAHPHSIQSAAQSSQQSVTQPVRQSASQPKTSAATTASSQHAVSLNAKSDVAAAIRNTSGGNTPEKANLPSELLPKIKEPSDKYPATSTVPSDAEAVSTPSSADQNDPHSTPVPSDGHSSITPSGEKVPTDSKDLYAPLIGSVPDDGDTVDGTDHSIVGGEETGDTSIQPGDSLKIVEATGENTIITISAIGDCTIGYDDTFGYDNRFDQVYKSVDYDAAYFFSNVLSVLGRDDLTIANLETTFTTATKKAEKTYRFKGDPSYVKILEEGSIESVNIANNHMFDYLQRGYDDTVATLEASEVAYFGYEVFRVLEIKGIRIGLAGFHIGSGDWSGKKSAITKAITQLQESADLLVFSFHWGIEGNYTPTKAQTSLARFCIDNGVDLVLGHHPHVLQGVETYNGRSAAYSLGNFCFGGNRNPKDKDTMIFQQQFEFDAQKELVRVHEHTIIPVSLSSVSNRNDYRPTVLEGDAAERVLAKIEKISADIR